MKFVNSPWNAVIIDDHLAIRQMTRRLLESGGHEVIGEAANGQDGLDAVWGLEPDVVLLDIALPDISGVEVAKQLKATGSKSAVVLISSYDLEDLGDPVAESGADAFLSKSDLTASSIEALGPFTAG